MKKLGYLPLIVVGMFDIACSKSAGPIEPTYGQVRGWNILSANVAAGMEVIDAASAYNINHLQLSHLTIMDLRDARDSTHHAKAMMLIKEAQAQHINEIAVWDHALYGLDYYPDKFKTGPDSTINLDNPAFWEWFQQDYKNMLALLPGTNAIVLTFIETGGRIEKQFSTTLTTDAKKLALVVDKVAEVVINDFKMNLYIRTFSYNKREYQTISKSIDLLKNKDVRLMVKETPHDFFLTHPVDFMAGEWNRPTIIEFDCGNEFSGQGIIANTFAEYPYKRLKNFMRRPNIIGYVARTDRFGNTTIIDTPNEVLLYTLSTLTADSTRSLDAIYDSFIREKYSSEALPDIKHAFELADDIVLSSIYTLGLNNAAHSKMNFEDPSGFTRHVSGRWVDNQEVFIAHGVNKKFHYWKDVVEHLCPPKYKTIDARKGENIKEIPEVFENHWLTPDEQMNLEYLKYILIEKEYGVEKAHEALASVEDVKGKIDSAKYNQLLELFQRTLLTAKLYKAAAAVYYGNRVYARGKNFQSDELIKIIKSNAADLLSTSREIEQYQGFVPTGQWNWRDDVRKAKGYCDALPEAMR